MVTYYLGSAELIGIFGLVFDPLLAKGGVCLAAFGTIYLIGSFTWLHLQTECMYVNCEMVRPVTLMFAVSPVSQV